MKNIILSVLLVTLQICFLYINSSAQSIWTWQNPVPTGNTLVDICVLDSNTIVTAGNNGTFLKTTNSGLNWYSKYNIAGWGNTNLGLSSVQFIDNNTGWVIGGGLTIAKTTNGGEDWVLQNQNYGSLAFYGCFFVSSSTGWVCGSSGKIWKTTNGGTNWTSQSSGVSGNIATIYFIDSQTGWAGTGDGTVANSKILKTTNGGTNWISYTSGLTGAALTPLSISFIDSQTGWACAFSGTQGPSPIIKTTNGGSTWNSISSMDSSMNRSIHFSSANNGISAGGRFNIYEEGATYKTTDGGTTWNKNTYHFQRPINSVKYFNSNIVWAVGIGGEIYKSTDGGDSWTGISSGYNFPITGPYFSRTSNLGWACGQWGGAYFKTTNAGTNWTIQYMALSGYGPQFNYFNSTYFLDDNIGWMVGSFGRVFKTLDGGSTWTQQNSGTYYGGYGYTGVYFADYNTGWIVGTSVIKKTTNGGTSWVEKYYRGQHYLGELQFVNSSTGYSWGYAGYTDTNGVALKTIDGGETWKVCFAIGNGVYINAGYFINESTGWVGGYFGTICKTTDGGDTWLQQTGGTTLNYIESLYFISPSTGWCGGSDNQLLYTSNGGTNWDYIQNPTNNSIRSIYFSDVNTGWLFGDNGTILKTTNGGLTGFSKNKNSLPATYNLSQNYPNPFNPTTNIKYQIKNNSFVSLKIYNILGKEIATLVNEKQAPGMYEVNWNASSYSSGVYFYKLSSDDFTETKKMILIK